MGRAKVDAIIGALRTGIVNVLIAGELCVRAILQQELSEHVGHAVKK